MEMRFSASMLECINSCKRSYFYKYVEKPDVKTNPYMALGMVLHLMFEAYYKSNFKSKESFQKRYAYEWNNACKEENERTKGIWVHDESEREKILDCFFWTGYHMAGKFYNKHKDKRNELEEIRIKLKKDITQKHEEEYLQQQTLSLFRTTKTRVKKLIKDRIKEDYEINKDNLFPQIEKQIKFQWEGYNLIAKIDRIDILDAEYYITDYKTGKNLNEPFKDHQFTIYYLAVLDKFGKPPRGMIKSYIRRDEDQIVLIGEEHFNYLKNDLKEATNFLKEVHPALRTVRYRKKKQKTKGGEDLLFLPFENQELESSRKILDIKRFKPEKEGKCYFCNYHQLCGDQIEKRENELKTIQEMNGLEEMIERFWKEIDLELIEF